jgi:hypothetical protein
MENPRGIREHECYSPAAMSDIYLQMVQQYVMFPLQIQLAGYFQQDGALLHFDLTVRAYRNHTFSD